MNAESISWRVKPGVDYVVAKTESTYYQGLLDSVDASGVKIKYPLLSGPPSTNPEDWAKKIEYQEVFIEWALVEDLRIAD